MQDLSTAFPSEGTTARPGRAGRRRASRTTVAAALAELEAAADESPLFRAVRRRRSQVSADGTTSVLTLAMPVRGVRRPGGRRDPGAPLRPGAGGARRAADVEYAVGGDAAESPGLRRPAAGPAAAGDRVRAAADPADHGRDVPQRADRAGLGGAQPGLGRRRVRHDDAGLPARLVRGRCSTSPARASSSTGCRCSSWWCWSGCRWTTTSSCSAGSASTSQRGLPTRLAVAARASPTPPAWSPAPPR